MAEVPINSSGIVRLDNSSTAFSAQQWAFAVVLPSPQFGALDRLYGHLLIGGCQANNPNQFYVMATTALWASPSLTVIANLFGTALPPSDFSDDLWYYAFKPRVLGIVLDVYGVR